MACGESGPEEFAKIAVGATVAPERRGECVPPGQVLGLLPDPGAEPAGVPYPTPAGARVVPGVTGVPLPPGAVEVDGFLVTVPTGGRMSGPHAVQVFDVGLPPDAVIAFFETALKERGWVVRGAGIGPAGIQCDFVPARDRGIGDPPHWITVSTAYVPRPGEDVRPPPGFRGKAVPFAEPVPGSTRFWLITPK